MKAVRDKRADLTSQQLIMQKVSPPYQSPSLILHPKSFPHPHFHSLLSFTQPVALFLRYLLIKETRPPTFITHSSHLPPSPCLSLPTCYTPSLPLRSFPFPPHPPSAGRCLPCPVTAILIPSPTCLCNNPRMWAGRRLVFVMYGEVRTSVTS